MIIAGIIFGSIFWFLAGFSVCFTYLYSKYHAGKMIRTKDDDGVYLTAVFNDKKFLDYNVLIFTVENRE